MTKEEKKSSLAKATEDKEANKESSLDEIKKKLEDLEKQKAEYLSGWQRERADFLNYKKEEMERIAQLINYSREELILKFLPVMDNFEVIEKNFSDDLKKDDSIKGFLQVKSQLENFLKSLGVEEIKSVGEKFDPHLHEVVEEVTSNQEPVTGKMEPGTIIEVIQKGYAINGRLLRPAKVRVVK